MSLIYSAINSLEKKQASEGLPAESQASSSLPPKSAQGTRWIYAAGIGSVAAVVIGGAALAMLRERSKEVSPPLRASAPSVVTPALAVVAQQPASQLPLAAPEPVQRVTVPVPVKTPEQIVTPALQPLAAKPAVADPEPAKNLEEKPVVLPVTPQPVAAIKPVRRTQPAQGAAGVNESSQINPAGVDLNRLALSAKQAIDAGNKEEAEALLGQLARNLHPESITLLRLRAWQALRNSDQSRAMMLYGQLVERLPDDESASINLAILNWKAGQKDEARRIVGALAERHPDSETVRRYAAQFGERL